MGIGLLIVQTQIAPDRLLIVIDQGHLTRASVPATLRTVGDLLNGAGSGSVTVAIVSGEQVVYPDADKDAITVSLSGDWGFLDDRQRQYGLTDTEAADILRGVESVRNTVARRLCASSATACGADVRATARVVVAATRERDAATLKSLRRVVEQHRPPVTVVVVTEQQQPLDPALGSLTVLRPGESRARTAAAAAPPAAASPRRAIDPAMKLLLDRATAHVLKFVAEASFLLADERYTQEVKSRAGSFNLPPTAKAGITVEKRQLDSEVAIVQITDQQLWLLARDVVRVDGKPVPESERQPIPAAAAASLPDAIARFREIAQHGARFNIGPVHRNINVPTLALWFLTPGIRDLFDFDLDGNATVDGLRCDVVRYREQGEGILRVDGRPVPAGGRFWIARDSGAVVRTELVLSNLESSWRGPGRGLLNGGRASVMVTYRFEPAVESWAPASMEERYDYPGRRELDWVVGDATYSNYRRFTVTATIVR